MGFNIVYINAQGRRLPELNATWRFKYACEKDIAAKAFLKLAFPQGHLFSSVETLIGETMVLPCSDPFLLSLQRVSLLFKASDSLGEWHEVMGRAAGGRALCLPLTAG